MLELLWLFLLISFNAFFAASEIALISLNEQKIKLEAQAGDKKAALILSLLSEPSRFLATIQIGITLAGFMASASASQSFAGPLTDVLKRTGLPLSPALLNAVAISLITFILSYFTLVFGELVPKRLAMQKARGISRFAARPLAWLARITSPFVSLLTASTNFFVQLFGGSLKLQEEVSEEEIRMLVDLGEEHGTIHELEKKLINNVFDFDDKVASEIMTPRTEIVSLPVDATLEEAASTISRHFTRLPVYKDSIDNIVGIIHAKDLLPFIRQPNAHFDLGKMIREVYFVPESKKISALFQEMQKQQVHLAIVLDEYGGTAGLVTIEDLLEEIVGNIFDEYDDSTELEYEQLDENTYLFSGRIGLDLVEELLQIQLPKSQYDTLGGYLTGELGRVPNPDEKPVLELDNVVFRAEKNDGKRILKIKVCKG